MFVDNEAFDVTISENTEHIVSKGVAEHILLSKYEINRYFIIVEIDSTEVNVLLFLYSFECIPVKHCHLSYALVLTCLDGFKLSYSGDCRPSDLLISKSKDANVLIHEATFEAGMLEEAKSKAHSTTDEAINVGLEANVQHILLTHFSQRYPKMPQISGEAIERVMTAFDLMSLSFSQLYVPKLMQVCQALLPSAIDED